jgi:curli production assembly/transport component CsgF
MGMSRSKPALRLSTVVACGAAAAAILASQGPLQAGSLVYTPINPSFGGNPNNGAVLLNEANAQNLPLANQQAAAAVAAAAAAAKAAAATGTTATPGQVFAQQLQSQLLSSFANQITQAIFGPNAQTSGMFSFGATTISFMRIATNIDITIFDGVNTTTIVVPSPVASTTP